MTVRTADFIVIGGGIAGASAAAYLAEAGRVVLLEAEAQPGYHSTGRSAALFSETYGNAAIRALTRASRDFYETRCGGLVEHPILTPRGVLLYAAPDQMLALEQAWAELAPLDGSLRWLDSDGAREIVPVLRPERAVAAIHEPKATDIDVHALHGAYLRLVRRRGGELVTDAPVTALSFRNGAWTVATPAGEFAGPGCRQCRRRVGRRRRPARRLAAGRSGAEAAHCADRAAACGHRHEPLAADDRRRGDRLFQARIRQIAGVAGGRDRRSSHAMCSPTNSMSRSRSTGWMHNTTIEVRRVERKWAGLRCFVADKTPVVGCDPLASGFFWLAGQGGYGIQTADGMARSAAALITENRLPPDIAALGLLPETLSPARFRG